MKRFIFFALFSAGLNVFAQQDSTARKDRMPNGVPVTPLLKDTLPKGPGMEYFRLPGGMVCVKPDSSYRASMPNGFKGRLLKRKE